MVSITTSPHHYITTQLQPCKDNHKFRSIIIFHDNLFLTFAKKKRADETYFYCQYYCGQGIMS